MKDYKLKILRPPHPPIYVQESGMEFIRPSELIVSEVYKKGAGLWLKSTGG